MDSLVVDVIPRLSFAVFKRSIAVRIPFLEKHRGAILLTKVGTQSFFKTATEDHRCPGFSFPPAIQVTVTIAARAAQVSACSYRPSLPPCPSRWASDVHSSASQSAWGAKASI